MADASIVSIEAIKPPVMSPHQALHPILGCLRLHNNNLRDRVLPLAERGSGYMEVFQQR